MRILGLDPGTATTGYAVVDVDGPKNTLITSGTIDTPANTPLEHRLAEIFQSVQSIISNYKPEQMAIEQLFFARNVKTAIAVGHARGVMILAGSLGHVPVFEYTPLQVKQAVTGYGKADKKQVMQMLKFFIKNTEISKQDDTCDAIAIALTHAQTKQSLKK